MTRLKAEQKSISDPLLDAVVDDFNLLAEHMQDCERMGRGMPNWFLTDELDVGYGHPKKSKKAVAKTKKRRLS